MKHILPRLTTWLLFLTQILSACGASPTPTPTLAPTQTPAPEATPTAPGVQPSPTPVTPKAATFLKLTAMPESAHAYSRVEFTVETDGVAANPFDPAEMDLRVRFTSPKGQVLNVPAFWYQEFDPATLQPVGAPAWRVRFTPTEAGQWSVQAELAAPQLTSDTAAFNVESDPDARGFVRLNPQNARYFAFENGDLYFPIGLNMGWPTSLDRTIPDYQRWFGRLSENGGNLARVWMASWSYGLEWNDTGLGNYAGRMKQAWLLDQVFAIAEEHDLHIMLCLLNHGPFSLTVNSEWKDNPYNDANGGMLKDPAAFVTDPEAKDLFKRRLRYIAARWGYSTQLFAWEWWNEVNWTPIAEADLKSWTAEMTAALQAHDPNHHLISTSYANGNFKRIWAMPEIDFAQQHDYTGHDPALEFAASYSAINKISQGKPLLMSEHGYTASGPDAEHDREAIHLHNGLWAAPFTGYAGSGLAWWWDNYVDPEDLWPEYKGLADFLSGEDLAAMAVSQAEAGQEAYAFALQGQTRVLVWVRHKGYEASASALAYVMAQANQQAPADWTYEPTPITGQTLTLSGMNDGDYIAYWYSPQTREWLAEAEVRVEDGTARLTLPDFSGDLAVKIVGANEPRTPGK